MKYYRLCGCAIGLAVCLLAWGCGRKTDETSSAAPSTAPAKPAPKTARKEAKLSRASVCLNGEWDFRTVKEEAEKSAPPKDGWRKVRVPSVWWRAAGQPAGAKSNNYEFDLPDDAAKAQAAWYRLAFMVPKEWGDGRQVALDFGGMNYRSRVFVNGEAADETEGGHLPVSVDVTKRVKFGAMNEVAVLVEAGPPDQAVAGLWRSVHLRSHPSVWIQNAFIGTSVRKKEISLKMWIRNETEATHRVVLKNAIREWGSEKIVNIFGDLDVGVEAGESKIVELKRSWANPRLWGFGEYGEPALYMLRSELRSADSGEAGSAGNTLDIVATRFGFREFWTSNKQFMFNGKPFFIKGDVFTPLYMLAHNREFITLFLQAERAANVNFIRLKDPNGFAPPEWYEAADELGMLIEPEACARFKKTKEGVELPEEGEFEVLKNEWEEFVESEGNHPSIVMYSCDNETCSQREDMVEGTVFAKLNDLHQNIRQNDPTRVIEEQGDVQLGMGAKLGIFQELQVFSVHLGGESLGPALEEIKKKYDYNERAPIHVGELALGEKEALKGEYLASSLKALKTAGAAGVSLCSGVGRMYLTAWAGKGQPVAPGFVKVRWPSISGEGMKVCWIDPSTNVKGHGCEFNWFDPTRPSFLTDAAYELVKKGLHDVDGQDVAPLAAKRTGEVVVGVAPDGKPLAGAYVFMKRKGQEGRGDEGVMTDSAGAAWVTPQEPGEYEVWADAGGKRLSGSVTVQAVELNTKPGYGCISWLDLTPDATAKIKAELSQAAVVEVREKKAQ